MNAMWMSKLKVWAAGVLTLAMLGGTTGAVVSGAGQVKGPEANAVQNKNNAPSAEVVIPDTILSMVEAMGKGLDLPKAEPGDNHLTTLLKERQRCAARELEARFKLFKAGSGRGTWSELINAQKRLLEACLALSTNADDRQRAYETIVAQARVAEAVTKMRFLAGQLRPRITNRVAITGSTWRSSCSRRKHSRNETPLLRTAGNSGVTSVRRPPAVALTARSRRRRPPALPCATAGRR